MISPKMNKILILTLLIYAPSHSAMAGQSQALVNGDIEANNQMNKMLQIPEVEAIYKGCQTTAGAGQISKCVWDAVKNDKSGLREKVLEAAKTIKPATDSASAGSPIKENFATDPALQKLGEIIGKKLQEALYGPEDPNNPNGNKPSMVDQKRYSEIYKVELGKTMVDAFMSYCLETVGATLVDNDQTKADTIFKQTKENNIKDLKADPINTLEGTPGTSSKWMTCLSSVKDHCINKNNIVKDPQKNRACLVTQYVEAAKKNLNILNETDSFYTSLGGGQSRHNTPTPDSVIVTTTSKDIEEAYKVADEKAKKAMVECLKMKNEEQCKQFLDTSTKDNEAGAVEYTLQQNADKENFDKRADKVNSQEDLITFLKERGYSQEAIAKMDLKDWPSVREQIRKRYKNEKEALIQEMNDRVAKKTSTADGKISVGDQSDQAKLVKIDKELQTRSKDMQSLVMFTNIVSGYLDGTTTSTDANGKPITKTERSTASLATELGSSEDSKKIKTELEQKGQKIDAPADTSQGGQDTRMDASQLLDPAPLKN